MDMTAKRKMNGLRMKHQNSASSVSRSFIYSNFQSLVSVAGCSSSAWQAMAHSTFASVHRKRVTDGMNLNYTIGCYPCHRKQTV